jgi:hypothetical protein
MKMFKKRYNKKHFSKTLYAFVIGISVILLTIGFSSFQNDLKIDNLAANVRIDKDVRVMGISLNETNDALSNYEEYNISNITSKIELPNEDSYVTYNVDVYNLGNVIMGIKSATLDNDMLDVSILNYDLKEPLCNDNECILGVKKTLQVKIGYKASKYDGQTTSFDVRVDFDFKQIFNVTYNNITGTSLPKYVMDGEDLAANFTISSGENISVSMASETVVSGYTYENGIFNLPSVSGDVIITASDMTLMKKNIIEAYVDSGSESDITLYDLDTMSSDDKTSTFSNIASDSGIYRTKGITGSGNAIVYRGSIANNYVSFGGNLWRILQIDEDGNLRLILNTSIGSSQYNTTSTISSEDEIETILGYENSSTKTTLDSWYTSNLSDYSEYIVDSKFCNDFTYETKTSSGASNDVYYFQSYLNVGVDAALYSPSLTCPTSSTFTNKIGLISAEEVVLAGGAYRKDNTSYFLYSSSAFWTLSPGYADSNQNNGGVFFVDSTGALTDWSRSLLTASYALRPVITINGNLDMVGDGTLSNPYRLSSEKVKTISKVNVTDLSTLADNKYYIANTGGQYSVDGLLSSTVSGIGLVGTNTATFSSDKETIISTTGVEFNFVNGKETTDGYLYQLKTDDNKYLTIGTDYTVTLSDTPVYLKISLCTASGYSGRIIISDETGAMYLNFYGAANTSDDKFAGWNSLDLNDYMILYKDTES